jgi:hypothetical protein
MPNFEAFPQLRGRFPSGAWMPVQTRTLWRPGRADGLAHLVANPDRHLDPYVRVLLEPISLKVVCAPFASAACGFSQLRNVRITAVYPWLHAMLQRYMWSYKVVSRVYAPHASPLRMFAAWRPWPMLTKSSRRKLGARPPPSGVQPYAFARILRPGQHVARGTSAGERTRARRSSSARPPGRT